MPEDRLRDALHTVRSMVSGNDAPLAQTILATVESALRDGGPSVGEESVTARTDPAVGFPKSTQPPLSGGKTSPADKASVAEEER